MMPAPFALSFLTMPKRRSISRSLKRGGRLVHHDDARVLREHLGDLDDLLLSDESDDVGASSGKSMPRSSRVRLARARAAPRSRRKPAVSGSSPSATFSGPSAPELS